MTILADGLCARIHAGRQIEPMNVLKCRGGMLTTSRFVSPAATSVSVWARSLRYLSLPSRRPLLSVAKAFIAKARNSVWISILVLIFIAVYSLRIIRWLGFAAAFARRACKRLDDFLILRC